MHSEKPTDLSAGRRARRYSSSRRRRQAAETRAVVLKAAGALFSERGWSGTGMRDIAAAADVSVETVYVHFRSKVDLLQAVLDVTVRGDDQPIPLAERPGFAAFGSGPRQQRLEAAARMMSSVHRDAKGVEMALREAAASDPNLAGVLRQNEERRRSDVERGVTLINGRVPTPTMRDGLWALLSFEVYQLLVDRSGWSSHQYETWLTDALARLLDVTEPEEGTRR